MATSIPAFLISYEFSRPLHQFPVLTHVTFVGVFSFYFSSASGLISSMLNVIMIRVNKRTKQKHSLSYFKLTHFF